MKPRFLHALLILFSAATAAPLRAQPAPVEQAAAAYGVLDVNRAEALYREAVASAATPPRERGIARRELARIAWLVDGDAGRALDLLGTSTPQDPDPCPAAYLYARILNDDQAARPAPSWMDTLEARCLAIEPGVATERVKSLVRAAMALPATERREAVAQAATAWNTLPADVQSGPEGSRLLLSLGLVSRDPDRALQGWRQYLGLAGEQSLPQALRSGEADGGRIFRQGLAQDASTDAKLELAFLLMRAGFEDDLRQLVADHHLDRPADDPRRRTIRAYLTLVAALAAEISAHDRRFARQGAADEEGYETRLQDLLRQSVAAVGERTDDLWPQLRTHFNLHGALGKSNGVSSLHLGHAVVDKRMPIEQGTRRGSIRFIAIDNMIHNGFSSWLADGASGAGGWAVDGTTIVQVRPRYLVSVETALGLARDGEARDRFVREMEIKRLGDRAIAQANPISFLPGVRDRLRLEGIDEIAARIGSTVGDGPGFAPAFRRAYSEAVFGSSILAHEGRHALDQLQFTGENALSNEELEYRAKLSEIAYAASPTLALSSIYSPLFGGSSGHGIANRRLAGELAAWIEAHAQAVEGHDPRLSPLEQLDRLSNDQLRAIVRSLDPAA
ncbi:hypothetical protein [Sphingosinicella sp. CPCC 101087]|uniref:hypothetical protein n=1 Tax=Sphingosinicella sp. CPCC 101087 TaxID=2497754 RepID=UPI00101CF76C|nr:hypothetical protein [Sphingosinicella sp. CPCC 101087]